MTLEVKTALDILVFVVCRYKITGNSSEAQRKQGKKDDNIH